MLSKESAKHFCQTGGLEILKEASKDLVDNMPTVDFDSNPNKLAYNVGIRDGYEHGLIELIEFINNKARE